MVVSQPVLAEASPETVANFVLLPHVSWETYESLLADYEDQAGPHFYYDNGVLEVKVLSVKHEKPNRTLANLVNVLAEEMGINLENLGSMTCKRDDLLKGFEPDTCFYIQNAEAIAGKDTIDLMTEPPPDLVIEVDITSGTLDKLALFFAFGVPEVWRYHRGRVSIYRFEKQGYVESKHSLALPILTAEAATQFVAEAAEMKSTAWLRYVRQWAREQLGTQKQAQDQQPENTDAD